MSGHDWERFDFDSQMRCRRCGLTVRATTAYTFNPVCKPSGVIGELLHAASFEFKTRVAPYTQHELDRAAEACKPSGKGWKRWILGFERPGSVVEVIDCFGKHHGPGPAFLYPFEDRVVWYRIREDLGVNGIDPAAPQPDATVIVKRAVDFHDKQMPKASDEAVLAIADKGVMEVGRYEGMTIIERAQPPGPDLGKAMKEAEKAALGFPHRNRHISDAAWKALALNSGWSDSVRADCERLYRRSGTVVLSGEEYDELTANQAKGAGLSALCAQKTIANLEAEVESLSRQLRSREINAETVSTGKRWRWSPLL